MSQSTLAAWSLPFLALAALAGAPAVQAQTTPAPSAVLVAQKKEPLTFHYCILGRNQPKVLYVSEIGTVVHTQPDGGLSSWLLRTPFAEYLRGKHQVSVSDDRAVVCSQGFTSREGAQRVLDQSKNGAQQDGRRIVQTDWIPQLP